MSKKVIYGQYDATEYPLKKFYYKEIPKEIKYSMFELNESELAVFRGGLAYIFLLDKKEYLLKDLDMIALESNLNKILQLLKNQDVIYVNHNTFGASVITVFWKSKNDYYKLDILLCKQLPELCRKTYEDKKITIISLSYLWKNRIEKIAQKEQRNHNDKKTLNHYTVVKTISTYLIEHKDEVSRLDAKIVEDNLEMVKKVLSLLIDEKELENFIEIQENIIRR